jgi:hypothetical protein
VKAQFQSLNLAPITAERRPYLRLMRSGLISRADGNGGAAVERTAPHVRMAGLNA